MSANCEYGRGIVLACPIFQPRSGSETSGSERRGGRGEHDRLGRARARRGLGYFGGEVSGCHSTPSVFDNVPLFKFHGVPETPVQLVAVVSQVAPLEPVQVPLVCAKACGVARQTRAKEVQQARKSERQRFGRSVE